MPKTLIFDFDGTVADTIPNNKEIVRLFNLLANDFGIHQTLTVEEVEKFRDEHLFSIIKQLQIPFFRVPFFLRKLQKSLRVYKMDASPIKGIKSVLEELRSNEFRLGIVSNSPKEIIESFLVQEQLQCFDFVYSVGSLFGKDRALKKLIKKYKLDNTNVFYVGDEIRDIDATKKADIPMIAVTWGFNSKIGLEKYKPDAIVQSPKELLSFVMK